MTDQDVVTFWQGLSLPKRGHSADEYEDAFAANLGAGRFAVADGASESSFAGLWARLLVESFVNPALPSAARGTWLEASRLSWASQVDERPLPWYAEEKRDQGAFATFLGLVIEPRGESDSGNWRTLAVGDSCLFLVRCDELLEAFPMPHSRDFSNQPHLLGSRGPPVDHQRDQHREGHGIWFPGDHFLLMTDALAQWFLSEHEAGRRPWHSLSRFSATAGFARLVEDLRERESLRNDDVTLVRIEV